MLYHASPNKFDAFNTKDVFVAKTKKEAMRYGGYVYAVTFEGAPKFDTPTIQVYDNSQVTSVQLIEHNPDQIIYRT